MRPALRTVIYRLNGIEPGLLVIFVSLVALAIPFQLIFIVLHWGALKGSGIGDIAKGLLVGLRFNAATAAFLIIPITPIYLAHAYAPDRCALKRSFQGCVFLIVALVAGLWLSDYQYFEESGKHFTYEATAYLDGSIRPVVSGAFALHPIICIGSILAAIGFGALAAWGASRLTQWHRDHEIRWGRRQFITLPILSFVIAFFGVGGFKEHALDTGDACVSPNPYVNALSLNPVYSILNTALRFSHPPFEYGNDESNIRAVREQLDLPPAPLASSRHPLMRESPGSVAGNRINVVIFILESWSAKDVGCLGADVQLTPEFDRLSAHGILFKNFFATGIRTAEGMFSILCSFPNQPNEPIMKRSAVYLTRWSSLSSILSSAGYRTLFIHGRGLAFDNMSDFLNSIGFNEIIDRSNFNRRARAQEGAWPGFDDEDVMRRADELFSEQKSPFFAMIYTMNTHPPFKVPDGFPAPFKPDSVTHKYFNAVRYTDSTLKVFFDLARKQPYFKDTIFILTADHTRTRDRFNIDNQHRIPLLIYAPGVVQPSVSNRVSSQLDIMPTVLGLLGLKTRHASWGCDLLAADPDQVALCVAGDEVRLHQGNWLLNDALGDRPPRLFDVSADPDCKEDVAAKHPEIAGKMKTRLRANIALSQTLLYQNRVMP